jgi:hypothetical protein
MITRCWISGNVNLNGGGGIDVWKASPVFFNCLITGNRSTATDLGGGGIKCEQSFPVIVNCTISGNSGVGRVSGGVECTDSDPNINNSIVWGNSSPQVGVHNTVSYPNRGPLVSFCDIQGAAYAGTGNIDSDPLFVNAAGGDFHLQAGSPCVDRASNPLAPETDLDGVPRPQDGNDDGLAIADMGAYELVGPLALSTRLLLDPSDPEYTPDRAFRNAKNRTALASKIEVVLLMIDGGQYAEAFNMLQNDVLKKVDGCAVKGAPDKDDWIVDCMYQQLIYQRVSRAIHALRVLPGEQ